MSFCEWTVGIVMALAYVILPYLMILQYTTDLPMEYIFVGRTQ
jgi:hypothetical protein